MIYCVFRQCNRKPLEMTQRKNLLILVIKKKFLLMRQFSYELFQLESCTFVVPRTTMCQMTQFMVCVVWYTTNLQKLVENAKFLFIYLRTNRAWFAQFFDAVPEQLFKIPLCNSRKSGKLLELWYFQQNPFVCYLSLETTIEQSSKLGNL